jgi:hypothetical protein
MAVISAKEKPFRIQAPSFFHNSSKIFVNVRKILVSFFEHRTTVDANTNIWLRHHRREYVPAVLILDEGFGLKGAGHHERGAPDERKSAGCSLAGRAT